MSRQTPIPIILFGCGAVSQQFYLPTLRVLAGAGELTVHALIDPSAAARRPLAEAFPQAIQGEDVSQLEGAAGSLAIIATPPRFHAAQTIAAVGRGWHVLCEKPMGSNVVECEEMIAAARSADRLLAVGLYKRFFPSSRYLKFLFTSQALGPLKSFTIAEGGPFRWPAASPSFFMRAQTGGGVLLDIGVHVLDLLAWWLGEPSEMHYADDAMGGIETNSRLDLTYPNGGRGAIHLSRDWATVQQYRFVFEGGVVAWKVNDANGLSVQLGGAPSSLVADLSSALGGSLGEATPALQPSNPQSFIAQLRNILAAVQGREPLLVPGEEGIRSLRLIEQCYRERTCLAQPWMTEAEITRAGELAAQR